MRFHRTLVLSFGLLLLATSANAGIPKEYSDDVIQEAPFHIERLNQGYCESGDGKLDTWEQRRDKGFLNGPAQAALIQILAAKADCIKRTEEAVAAKQAIVAAAQHYYNQSSEAAAAGECTTAKKLYDQGNAIMKSIEKLNKKERRVKIFGYSTIPNEGYGITAVASQNVSICFRDEKNEAATEVIDGLMEKLEESQSAGDCDAVATYVEQIKTEYKKIQFPSTRIQAIKQYLGDAQKRCERVQSGNTESSKSLSDYYATLAMQTARTAWDNKCSKAQEYLALARESSGGELSDDAQKDIDIVNQECGSVSVPVQTTTGQSSNTVERSPITGQQAIAMVTNANGYASTGNCNEGRRLLDRALSAPKGEFTERQTELYAYRLDIAQKAVAACESSSSSQ